MSWQDCVFGVGGFFFALSMVPTIRSKTAEVPLRTSLPTTLILAGYVVAEWTIQLYLAAIAGGLTTTAWALVAILRRPRKDAVPDLRDAAQEACDVLTMLNARDPELDDAAIHEAWLNLSAALPANEKP